MYQENLRLIKTRSVFLGINRLAADCLLLEEVIRLPTISCISDLQWLRHQSMQILDPSVAYWHTALRERAVLNFN